MSTPATINGNGFFELLREDLAAIEREFGRDTVSGVEAITEIGEYLRGGGGKRIRPALLLLSAKLLNYQGRGAVRLGAVVEIIHTATLVHDDIIDEAQTRRGRPAANTQWGNSKCVLAGDWLYMQAFKVAVQERNFRILDTLIDLTQQMVEGELLQMEKLGKLISLDEHFNLIFRKTACLFSVCMRMGGPGTLHSGRARGHRDGAPRARLRRRHSPGNHGHSGALWFARSGQRARRPIRHARAQRDLQFSRQRDQACAAMGAGVRGREREVGENRRWPFGQSPLPQAENPFLKSRQPPLIVRANDQRPRTNDQRLPPNRNSHHLKPSTPQQRP